MTEPAAPTSKSNLPWIILGFVLVAGLVAASFFSFLRQVRAMKKRLATRTRRRLIGCKLKVHTA